jgi:hypothetical protein
MWAMKLIYLVSALALLGLSAAAQDKSAATILSATSVQVDGQPIRGKVLEMDGKYYVAVEDLAQSLRGTIGYGDGQISLTLPSLSSSTVAPTPQPPAAPPRAPAVTPQPPALTPTPVGTGSIKGTLTYFFSFHDGNKPDIGSKVWLVAGRAQIPADQTFVATSTSVGTTANPQQYSAMQYALTNDAGSFELRDVPAGEYTLILQSAHTKGALKEKTSLFGRANGRTLRDSDGRIEFLTVSVKANETVDASKDFGPDLGR